MLNARPTEEGAWQSQVFQITVADIIITPIDVLADEGAEERDAERIIVDLRAVVGNRRGHSLGSDIRVAKMLE
jgi:hypothetical protein